MKKYRVSRKIINMWYRILGLGKNLDYRDKKYYYFDDLSEMVSSFSVASLFAFREEDDVVVESYIFNSILNSLIQIHDKMVLMSNRLEDDSGILISLSYEKLSIILNAVTSLDLLEYGDEELKYFRIREIQQVVLKELALLDTEFIFLISDLLMDGKIVSLLEFKKICPATILLLVKFLLKDMDIKDNEIFMDNTNIFSLSKLYDVSLIASKVGEVTVADDDILSLSKPFKGMSYSRVKKKNM